MRIKLLIFVVIFMEVKEALAQQLEPAKSIDTVQLSNIKYNPMFSNCYVTTKDATFPGGTKALNAYLLKNLHLPHNLKGRIITYFVIEKDGSLTDIRIIKGLNTEADTEVIRALNNMPKWTPAIQAGKPSRVAYTLPLNFGEANLVKD